MADEDFLRGRKPIVTDDIIVRLERHASGTQRADGSTHWVEVGPSLAKLALAEIKRLRQGLWDCAVIAGIDPDGNQTPDHLIFPDIVIFAYEAVKELRQDYDDFLDKYIVLGKVNNE